MRLGRGLELRLGLGLGQRLRFAGGLVAQWWRNWRRVAPLLIRSRRRCLLIRSSSRCARATIAFRRLCRSPPGFDVLRQPPHRVPRQTLPVPEALRRRRAGLVHPDRQGDRPRPPTRCGKRHCYERGAVHHGGGCGGVRIIAARSSSQASAITVLITSVLTYQHSIFQYTWALEWLESSGSCILNH